ncbi:DUF262 domain-containing protein [Marinomonas sp.]|uniref:DUF262 domain-containing protein n=1 Tax=Marinomonas sp. TaxID=1904862 RepID=UPI003BAD5A3C
MNLNLDFDENESEDIDDDAFSEEINSPFSTKDIKVSTQTIALSSLVNRLQYEEIDLQPNFQRKGDLWTNTQMSRLIESILLKMPLPIFYFDVSNPDKWQVVDGLQRLSTIKRFAVEKKLKLTNLEFLINFNGTTFDSLPRPMQRVIEETQIVTYQIEPQTPKEVRYSIFNRINTGGLKLNSQEIRQALNQKGISVQFLKDVCETDEFKKIVNLKTDRMLDRELALRFFAFKILPIENSFKSLATFLDRAIEEIDKFETINEELENLKNQFIDSLILSEELLGEGHKFSRSIALDVKKSLNRSFFDVLTVCLSNCNKKNKLIERKSQFKEMLINLISDDSSPFSQGIYQGTGSKRAVFDRFDEMEKLIEEVVK